MEIIESLTVLIQEKLLPDVNRIKEDNSKIITTLELTNKRLDDINNHLADQSRRIDEVRTELSQRIDETNKRIDDVRSELTEKIHETNKRIEEARSEMNSRMYDMHVDLVKRLDSNNARIDQFFQITIPKQEIERIEDRIKSLENEVKEIRQQIAA